VRGSTPKRHGNAPEEHSPSVGVDGGADTHGVYLDDKAGREWVRGEWNAHQDVRVAARQREEQKESSPSVREELRKMITAQVSPLSFETIPLDPKHQGLDIGDPGSQTLDPRP
jgi:hypothetical protein